ncbi:MAG TPA: peptidylprolyl isomerase [Flavobacteriales bacterium]|nr:peptidylprolyl isomerase [Flavobacteriales bacterium]
MNKRIVKCAFYAQFIVSSAFLLTSCTEPNRFSEDHMRQVHTFGDERNTSAVIDYLKDKDEAVRAHACELLASQSDSLAIGPLLHYMEFDPSEHVRASAAFALGQYQMEGLINLMLRWAIDEKSTSVKKAVIIAVGKSGGGAQLVKFKDKFPENLNEALAEALFYSTRKLPETPELIPLLQSLLKEEGEARFYAASALCRIKGNIQPAAEELKKFGQSEDEIPTRMALLRAWCIAAEKDSLLLLKQFGEEEKYLCRLSIFRGIQSWKGKAISKFLLKALVDESFHIRESAAEYCLNNPSILSSIELEKIALNENHARARYMLLEAALKNADVKQSARISSSLQAAYSKEQDEYVRGFILNALSADFSNLAILEEECFNTTSILIREFSFEALLKIRRDERFPQFAQIWQNSTASQSLEEHFKKVILDAMATYDVSLVAIASTILRDTTLPGNSPSIFPIPSRDIKFLEDALNQMRLPRDIESYGEILKTIRFFEGNPIEGNLKPEMNNPINWQLVERIPDNQQIEIHTDAGIIRAELWVNDAPGTVANFIHLIQDSFYINKRLHRVVPGFVIQDGCPRGDGYGSRMETIRSEFSSRNFDEGILGMASAGPDTESCQWFITHTRTPHLNGRYTAFGKVVDGMDVVHKLGIGAKIQRIELLAP